jgi:glycosyltransferase involved in cell wall biosynthesis
MRIGIVADKLDRNGGGSNHSLHVTARELERRDHDVTVFCLNVSPAGNDPPEERSYSFVDVDFEYYTMSDGLFRAVRFLRAEASAYDLWHIWKPRLAPAGGLYRKTGGDTPVVARLNSYSFCSNIAEMCDGCWENCTVPKKVKHCTDTGWRRIAKLPMFLFDTYLLPRLLNACDGLFAQSPAVQHVYTEIGVDSNLIDVIGNFFDTEFPSDPNVRSTSEPRRILYVGRLRGEKGVDILLEAVATLADEEWSLDIVGDGEPAYLSQLRQQCVDLGIEGRITFHGWIPYDSIHAVYEAADLFVHPGVWPDPFPRTTLEAMQAGVPMIVSNTGGPEWAVGRAALTFEQGDAEDLAVKIRTLWNDSVLREELTRRSQERLQLFRPESTVMWLEKKYRDALERPVRS